jgi:hypothetical protein
MKWGPSEVSKWLSEQTIKRSYENEVAREIQALHLKYEVSEYGRAGGYPVYIVKSKTWDPRKKTVLITGGVHGYETSGVHGALEFLTREAAAYAGTFNFVCVPCVSPWAYESINRWNQRAIDPNRSFTIDSLADESRLLCRALQGLDVLAHFDLHETTDTDNSVFRPAKERRDGTVVEWSEIPDGFYVVGDTENPQPEFQKAVVDSVRQVTHIAKPDASGKLIGETLEQDGVINYPLKKLSLCTSITNAKYTTTTEVYPDSPRVTPQICIGAQVAAIKGGLEFLSALSVE